MNENQEPYKEIELTKGFVAMVSLCDYEEVSRFTWHAAKNSKTGRWYAQRTVREGTKKYSIWMHRQIMRLTFGDGKCVDHKEPSQTLDNRRSNLRIATRSQNRMNEVPRPNRSGFRGVRWRKDCQKWEARIKANRVEHSLGMFASAEHAHRAYCDAAKIYHGEFARTS